MSGIVYRQCGDPGAKIGCNVTDLSTKCFCDFQECNSMSKSEALKTLKNKTRSDIEPMPEANWDDCHSESLEQLSMHYACQNAPTIFWLN